jgi:cathepsin L
MASSAFLVSALVLAVATAVSLDGQPDTHAHFQKYASDFGKVYVRGSEEYNQRLALFQMRMQHIEAHNAKKDRLWTAGANTLTDLTEEELAQLRGWRRGSAAASSPASPMALLSSKAEVTLDESVDWRNLSMKNALFDQGGCGSCWAVATSNMLQARYEAKTGLSRTFSAQQLVNCVENPHECGGTGGCQGATVELAMDYIQNNPSGLSDADAVAYTASDGRCGHHQTYSKSAHIASSFLASRYETKSKAFEQFGLTSWHKLEENKARPLMEAVMAGPVAISASANAWASYDSGIFDSCSKDAVVNHAIVLFGYGSENGKPYWTVKNSWGKFWGEHGYIRLLRQDTPEAEDKYCGVNHDPGQGVACKDENGEYPKSAPVCGMCGLLFDSVAAHFVEKR